MHVDRDKYIYITQAGDAAQMLIVGPPLWVLSGYFSRLHLILLSFCHAFDKISYIRNLLRVSCQI